MLTRINCKCFHLIAFCLLASLFLYGAVGIVLNALALSEEGDEDEAPWPINHRPVFGVLSVVQSFFVISLVFGILGFWKRERNFYLTACFIILGLFATLLVFGIVCIRTSQKDMTADIFKFLQKNQKRNESIQWFLDLQFKYKCCGVVSYTDWLNLNQAGKITPPDSVPTSCCWRKVTPPGEKCGHGILTTNDMTGTLINTKEKLKEEQIIYTEPCNSKISAVVREKSMSSGTEMIIVALTCLLIAAFLYCGATEMFCLRGQFAQRSRISEINDTTRSVRFDSFDNESESLERASSQTRGARLNSKGEVEMHQRNKHSSISKGSNTGLHPGARRPNVSFLATTESGTPIKSKMNSKGRPKSNQPLKKNLIGIKELNNINNNNNYQEIRRVGSKNPIESRKTQIRKPNRTTWKWKANSSRVDSKALILGEQKQRIAEDSNKLRFPAKDDMIRKQLEMLYDGVDKNVSTLSTTPNPSGTLSFPWSLVNKTAAASPVPGANANTSTKSPLETKDNNSKRLFPSVSLSHYSSLPLFHLVKFPNGELGTLGQYSPHFVSNRHQRHNHRYFYTPPPPSAFGSPTASTSTRRSNTPLSTAAAVAVGLNSKSKAFIGESQPQKSVTFSDINDTVTETNNTGPTEDHHHGGVRNPSTIKIPISDILEPPENNNISNSAVYASPASTSVSTTARSSTLATIQEESESVRSTPQGATPASPSPTETGSETHTTANNNIFEGNFIVNNLSSNNLTNISHHDFTLTIPPSQINVIEPFLGSSSAGGETICTKTVLSEEELEKPLKPVGTGEFVVGSTISVTDHKEEASTMLLVDDIVLNEYQNQPSKLNEFETEQTDMIEETISEIGALPKVRTSTAQFPIGFN